VDWLSELTAGPWSSRACRNKSRGIRSRCLFFSLSVVGLWSVCCLLAGWWALLAAGAVTAGLLAAVLPKVPPPKCQVPPSLAHSPSLTPFSSHPSHPIIPVHSSPSLIAHPLSLLAAPSFSLPLSPLSSHPPLPSLVLSLYSSYFLLAFLFSPPKTLLFTPPPCTWWSACLHPLTSLTQQG